MAGYKFVPLERMVQMIEGGNFSKVAAVTFDDGLNDLYENAFPIMKEHHIPFTCFLITSLLDSTRLLWLHKLYISWDRVAKPVRNDILRDYIEVDDTTQRDEKVAGDIVHSLDRQGLVDLVTRLSEVAMISPEIEAHLARDLYLRSQAIEEMQANGLTIELHGHNHWPLTKLSEEETKQELETSLTVIREKLQSRAQFFAMPYGKSNPYLKDVAKQLDIKRVFTIQGKLLTGHNKDPYNLPRFCIYDDVQAFYRSLSLEFIKYIAAKFLKN
jgi:peptidoglycan/xylan/chitin deacetylase (PgdA/CDA1 family)